mmetsp:Transcript_34445/g.32812  ORF Transcript_34445/g.32812 Transcript_34445/m.32812 type:complete len:95 (+) Transcript_34445:203-487(+)
MGDIDTGVARDVGTYKALLPILRKAAVLTLDEDLDVLDISTPLYPEGSAQNTDTNNTGDTDRRENARKALDLVMITCKKEGLEIKEINKVRKHM